MVNDLKYYDIDAESGTPVVMADQLCGDFYARLLGLPPVVSDNNSRSTLKAVKESCFEAFDGGSLGVANGLRRDGTPLVFFFKQKTAYEIGVRLVGSEMCIRDRHRAGHLRRAKGI